MQQRAWRRRNYFVRRDFQGKFILKFFLAILVSAFVFTSLLSIFSAHTITVTYEDSYLRLDRTPKALFLQTIRAYGVYILLLGVGVSVVSLFLSHRIAGPLYRFEKSAEEITKGNLSFRIRLRKKDEGKELAGRMNTMIETLSDRLADIGRHAEAAQSGMAGLSESLAKSLEEENPSAEQIRRQISDAMNSLENLRKSLSFFSVDKG
ncbi:MAG: methyl-accepting chemotaxis protein [Nitrospirae bacterium]|nr:methyl-accepting chemotaxis protein [Nitrospirota bacterium]